MALAHQSYKGHSDKKEKQMWSVSSALTQAMFAH